MNLDHINVKFFVQGPLSIDLQECIDEFHRWVAGRTMPELLIDVADYRHVPAGPGVVLVGLEADYAMDLAEDRPGLLYNRKAPLDGTNSERLNQAVASAAAACRVLESTFATLKFDYSACEISINDRAIAPNSAETYSAVEPILREFLGESLGVQEFELKHDDRDLRRRFKVAINFSQPIDASTLSVA